MYLLNRESDLCQHLHLLCSRYSSSTVVEERIFRLIIDVLKKTSRVNASQHQQLLKLYSQKDAVVFQSIACFKRTDDLSVLQTELCERVASRSNPMSPPRLSLRDSQLLYRIPMVSLPVVKSCIHTLALLDHRQLTEAACLDLLFAVVLTGKNVFHSTQHPSFAVPSVPFRSLLSPSSYPSSDIQQLFSSLKLERFVSQQAMSQLLQMVSAHAFSVYYAYSTYLRTRNAALFRMLLECCVQECDDAGESAEEVGFLPDPDHSLILQQLLQKDELSEQEVSVIAREYCVDEENVFYSAFKIYEREMDQGTFVFGLKRLAAIFCKA